MRVFRVLDYPGNLFGKLLSLNKSRQRGVWVIGEEMLLAMFVSDDDVPKFVLFHDGE